jgi:tRNA G18 (ribose-2'-O)-methylase SpoU
MQNNFDTHNAVKSLPYFHYESLKISTIIYLKVPALGVELDENAEDLETFEHPRRCVYLLGAEDNGLTKSY